MLKSKLSRGPGLKRRRKNRPVQPAEVLETKVLLSATGDVHHGSADEVTARIVNGSETDGYEAVGIVNNGCTGTLISATHVLTAAHCTEGVGDRRGTFDVNGQTYQTTNITDHPQYNPNRFDVGYDISIMQLDRPVNGVTPMQINRDTPRVGQLLTLVGFGEGGTSTGGSLGDFGNKRVGETEIDNVTNLHVEWDFDSHNESNTAPGDSGGPAFLTVGGELFIAGVTSGGTGDAHQLGDNSFDTRVDTFASWIDSIVGDDTGGGGGGGGGEENGDRFEFSNDQGKNIRADRVHTITSKIDVAGLDGTITDLNVELDISHTYTSDLVVHLIAPDGTRIQLFRDVGGDGSDFNNTGLDDEATSSIKNADAPFRGVFKPAGKLSKFDGKDPNGVWKLRIKDTFEEDGGRLNSWTLSFQTDADNGGGGGSDDGSFTNDERVNIAADRPNTIKSRLTVDGLRGSVSDIRVKLNISHTWDDDLLVTLVSPSGSKVQLVRYVGGDGDGFTNTVLNDGAGQGIGSGNAPFTGTFRPHQSLTRFNGEDPNGVWTLIVRDRAAEDGGSLDNWTLTIETDGARTQSGDQELMPRQEKVRRFRSIRQEMRRGRAVRTDMSSPRRNLGKISGSDKSESQAPRQESYRQARTERLRDRVFSMVDLEQLFSSL